MLISFKWLKKFVKLADSTTPEEVAQKLTLSTVEVEGIIKQGEHLDNVVVGKILKVEKHPQADKLNLCTVDVGNEQLLIVCGGSNVVEGMLVAVAKVGSRVRWHGEGDLITLEPAMIRGVESRGMICGADEIGLIELFPKKSEKEIVDLSHLKIKPGTPLAEALGLNDVIFEIDNKSLSNRPDLWGHYGIAREVAVLYNREVQPYETQKIKPGKEIELKISVEDKNLCPRYMAVQLSGIKINASPAWMQQALLSVGIRPINVIVDITNYVMLETGQPLHAFDAMKVSSINNQVSSIVVRKARESEKILLLDGKEYTLPSETLVIAGEEKVLAIAGVMGGEESGIHDDTTSIILESANFNASSIRKTIGALNLRTDAAVRFEKSLDPNLCSLAQARAVELITELCPEAKVVSSVIDIYPEPQKTKILTVSPEVFEKKIGTALPLKTIIKILTRLGFEVKEDKEKLKITIPTWRATKDITIPEDIVEEVLRIYGYENIPSLLPELPITPPLSNPIRQLEHHVRDILVREFAFTETALYSFISPEQITQLGDDTNRYAELANPLSKEKPFSRRSLLPNLLESLSKNTSCAIELRLLETGKTFIPEEAGARTSASDGELLPRQDTQVCFLYTNKNDKTPWWTIRQILERLGKGSYHLQPATQLASWQHPGRTADIVYHNQVIGSIAELHPATLERHGLSERVAYAEINLSMLASLDTQSSAYHALPRYPEVVRDVAFLIDRNISHEQIILVLQNIHSLLQKIELFDVYSGEHVKTGYKSMAYRLTYADPEKTLTTEEVEKAHQEVIKKLQEMFKIEVR
jgi:phenylalanyl-tRNA synthetase beta chain